jgi:phosphoadenosine phosphosulfate reductase
MSPDYGVLTFDGIRRAESARRSKYSRLSDKHKIAGETLASPILQWTELAVWTYLMFHNIFFNPAYKKGFRRVGCLYCPFNSDWSYNMIMHRYPGKGKKWQTFLHEQAERMQHPQPEIFADKGWRARAGGRGLDHYKTSLESTPCVLSEHAVMYQILSGDVTLTRFFLRPLGPQSRVARDEFSETFLILDYKSKEPVASVEVSYNDEAVRINYLIKKYRRLFQQRIEGQLKKLQSCIFCGACGSKCKINALATDGSFVIDDKKCVSCLACVQHKCPIVDSLTKKGK